MGFLYQSLGLIIFGITVYVAVFFTVKALQGGSFLLVTSLVVLVAFMSIYGILSSPTCSCLLGNSMFNKFTQFFMDKILPLVSKIFIIWILLMLLEAFIRGERVISIIYFGQTFFRLFVGALFGIIVSSIIRFYVCPLICEHYIDWDLANQNIWHALRRWLGTE